jgi:pilus assembly protein CpaF
MNLINPDKWPDDLLTDLNPIIPLLEDDDVTEIEVLDFDHIRAKGRKWKGHKLCDLSWGNVALLLAACTSIGELVERSVFEDKPVFDGRLPGGERVHIVVPPVSKTPTITIRKFPKETMTLEKLLGYGSINTEVAEILNGLISLRKNIIVAGGTDSGKTSLLNALSLLIDPAERIVTIEDAKELQIQKPIWVPLETLKPPNESVDEVTIADLVKASLRMTPDRIIVGEVRDKAAHDLLRTFSTGHSGGLSTVHSNSAPDALAQLQQLTGGASPYITATLVARAVDIVIYVKKIEADNSRKVDEIIEVDRPKSIAVNGQEIYYRYRSLMKFNITGYGDIDPNGFPEVQGQWDYPNCPSTLIKDSIRARNMNPYVKKTNWPTASLEATDSVETF